MINGDEMNISMENMIREKEVSGTKSFFQNPYSLPSSRLEKVNFILFLIFLQLAS